MIQEDYSLSLSLQNRPKSIQIHPLQTCNLFCKHCYSQSGPRANTKLEIDTVLKAISDAHDLGYQYLSVSGGEPFLYGGLEKIVSYGKSLGMLTSIATNGTILERETLLKLKDDLDILAVSIDGPPQVHNHIRGSAMAFDALQKGLDTINEIGMNFGFIHTLTRENWEQLLWTVEFASTNHASLFQIHPLELAGRATMQMGESRPDDDILARVYLITLALASKYRNKMRIQFDAFRRDYIIENPEYVYASNIEIDVNRYSLSDALDSLVVEPDGAVVPIVYGISRKYQICNLNERRLRDSWSQYFDRGGYSLFRSMCKDVYNRLLISDNQLLPFFAWYESILVQSRL